MMSAETARSLSRKINLLFWFAVAAIILGFFEDDLLGRFIKTGLIAGIGVCVFNALAGAVLITMGAVNERYRTAGIINVLCAVLSGIIPVVENITGTENDAVSVGAAGLSLLAAAAGILAIYAVYCEYKAHSEVLSHIDRKQSEAWMKLWNWYIIGFVCSICSILLVFIFWVLGVIAAAASIVIVTVVGIIRLVYLHKTMKIIDNYGKDVRE